MMQLPILCHHVIINSTKSSAQVYDNLAHYLFLSSAILRIPCATNRVEIGQTVAEQLNDF